MICSFIQLAILPITALICSQCCLTTTTMVAIKATIPATIPATNAGAPKIIAPTATSAIPRTISASFTQLNPFFNMDRKLNTERIAPPTIDTTPASGAKAVCNASSRLLATPRPSEIPILNMEKASPIAPTNSEMYGNIFTNNPLTPLNNLVIPPPILEIPFTKL